MIEIIDGVAIPKSELIFTASRSGGPGGQNVNKVSTRVTLMFFVDQSKSLTPEQRMRIHSRLSNRINKEGALKLTSQRTRSQDLNMSDVIERFASLLRDALRVERPRIPTKVTRAAQDRRLQEKKKHTKLKRARTSRPGALDE